MGRLTVGDSKDEELKEALEKLTDAVMGLKDMTEELSVIQCELIDIIKEDIKNA